MSEINYNGFSSVLIDRRDAAASPTSSPTTKAGYDASGRWRATTPTERANMTFEERWLHGAAQPGEAERQAAIAEARRWTGVHYDSDWQARRTAEQAEWAKRG